MTPSHRNGSIADHPRSRGVYDGAPLYVSAALGSSPLARGLPGAAVLPRITPRIIPARAGFTSCFPAHINPTWDHPRSRGVYHDILRPGEPFRGSSPLARGLRAFVDLVGDLLGIIPARAGFTWLGNSQCAANGDHPRSRGVYGADMLALDVDVGSSPLARGLR